ncbi:MULTISPECIES: PriCT-2 domain-containing protein [Flavobacterium]|uniref:PriCT-2 domain-containing protein n=1 Tax=Flavobacterium TaxID=237 RepID=UPI00211521DF|nr:MULTISPECIES: PriCT-2 domain-containing protein [Flavobacterium]UUF15202.1 PriCT-2 domain-containing protein [Flavobacterium panici]
MKNVIISKFSNYKSASPIENISLYDWFRDDRYKDLVYYIRTLSDKNEIRKLKSELPCITPSGEFTSRNAKALIQHSGFICIDIDGADNLHLNDFVNVRDQLKKIKNISYVALSVSGKGVFCLIPIKFPEKHKEHFEALKILFLKFKITIDKSCGDVSRLRGYSYDENDYINENATVFEHILEYKHEKSHKRINSKIRDNEIKEKMTFSKVMRIVNKLNDSSIDMTENYDQWFQIGCALANEFGDEGRDIFHLVSQNHSKYHFDECDRFFTNCLEKKYSYGIGTFFYWTEQYGII